MTVRDKDTRDNGRGRMWEPTSIAVKTKNEKVGVKKKILS